MTILFDKTQLLGMVSSHQDNSLSDTAVQHYLSLLEGWALEGRKITKAYSFQDYYHTLAYVNAIAYVIHVEDHHPELIVMYNHCVVKFDTHSVNGGQGGISLNDFICAAKLDRIFDCS